MVKVRKSHRANSATLNNKIYLGAGALVGFIIVLCTTTGKNKTQLKPQRIGSSNVLDDVSGSSIMSDRKKIVQSNKAALVVAKQRNTSNSNAERPSECTRDQLLTVRSHLYPRLSLESLQSPWEQKSGITKMTKCPNPSNWLDEYYLELQEEYKQLKTSSSNGNSNSNIKDDSLNFPFVGMSVGCNKGFDALNTLRMGTFDASLVKSDWNKAMTDGDKLYHSVCKQSSTESFQVDEELVLKQQPREGSVHCFEPMPNTFKKLQKSAESLGYDKKGFKVVNGAVSKDEGKTYFKTKLEAGVENQGLGNACSAKSTNCDEVDILTLEKYVDNHVDSDGPIHILQIDVEGFDGDVMLGAGDSVLKRVEYLEFEYNWMGSWENQHLYDMIDMLDQKDFTCYWAGNEKLWRITGCWMQYFDVHLWSNVACVNRSRVPRLAYKMEDVFQKTLKATDVELDKEEVDESLHEILSTDAAKMSLHYLPKK
uniref:Methyltransferase FkbM domain-containing protein n=1 Tax=Chaetoceros debilis TaxID=122233 RepID=A0A6S8XPX8_9STRA|eukprot:CAMPEP_0194075402 /NCGR_PEP_ID=MMETSP0149-20130528/2416_1 /TAXON_ID=122233 /ORGANISM="Chaetoceros debilis, Strain MM31A-1" /LENGTH=480 /DNA_ID=CAMNT_0038755867 /DNA_START=155 /DNA_END=1597 /DNA_ORIENTATION=-